MTSTPLRKRYTDFQSKLKLQYPSEEIGSIFNLLLEHLSIKKYNELLTDRLLISVGQEDFISEALERLLNDEPIQYILGTTEFYGIELKVSPAALIPRPETEELVHWILKEEKPESLLDIGTGSGAIALALKFHLKETVVEAVDISPDALALARTNAEKLQLEVLFQALDILQPMKYEKAFEVVVSNPPYIPQSRKSKLKANVIQNEPEIALFVADDNPLVFYKAIGQHCKSGLLAENGALYFECDDDYAQATVEMLEQLGFSKVYLKNDLNGIPRMIQARL